jgi:hypothetical protein
MQTLEHALTDMVRDGVVDYDAAVEASLYPKDIVRPAPTQQRPGSPGQQRGGVNSSTMKLAAVPNGNGSPAPSGTTAAAGRH